MITLKLTLRQAGTISSVLEAKREYLNRICEDALEAGNEDAADHVLEDLGDLAAVLEQLDAECRDALGFEPCGD